MSHRPNELELPRGRFTLPLLCELPRASFHGYAWGDLPGVEAVSSHQRTPRATELTRPCGFYSNLLYQLPSIVVAAFLYPAPLLLPGYP